MEIVRVFSCALTFGKRFSNLFRFRLSRYANRISFKFWFVFSCELHELI